MELAMGLKTDLLLVYTIRFLFFRFSVQQHTITMSALEFALCFCLVSVAFSSPPKLVQLHAHYDLVENITFPLTCSLLSDGGQSTAFQWTFNGVQLENSSDYRIDSLSSKFSLLTISFVQRRHSGFYECRVVNSYGEADVTKTKINVQGIVVFCV